MIEWVDNYGSFLIQKLTVLLKKKKIFSDRSTALDRKMYLTVLKFEHKMTT